MYLTLSERLEDVVDILAVGARTDHVIDELALRTFIYGHLPRLFVVLFGRNGLSLEFLGAVWGCILIYSAWISRGYERRSR